MQAIIRVILLCALFCIPYSLQASTSLLLPINKIAEYEYSLAINIPNQYRALAAKETGAIPGILTLLAEGYEQNMQNFVYDGHDMRRLPQLIRLQQTKGKQVNVNQFIHALKGKIKKELLVPPAYVEEYMEVTKEYTLHSLGLILEYSGQPNVEVIYLQYYSGNNHLSGIQVERSLPPEATGQPASLESTKKELKALKNFVNNVTYVRRLDNVSL